ESIVDTARAADFLICDARPPRVGCAVVSGPSPASPSCVFLARPDLTSPSPASERPFSGECPKGVVQLTGRASSQIAARCLAMATGFQMMARLGKVSTDP